MWLGTHCVWLLLTPVDWLFLSENICYRRWRHIRVTLDDVIGCLLAGNLTRFQVTSWHHLWVPFCQVRSGLRTGHNAHNQLAVLRNRTLHLQTRRHFSQPTQLTRRWGATIIWQANTVMGGVSNVLRHWWWGRSYSTGEMTKMIKLCICCCSNKWFIEEIS